MNRKRILFSIDDFKTYQWGEELKKYNWEVVPTGIRLHSQLKIILSDFLRERSIHTFVFRYLNDRKSFSRSVKFFCRDLLIIMLCKLLRIRVMWILHNIDEETHHFYPFLSRLRRRLVSTASETILVADPLLKDVAHHYGFPERKLAWTCFGVPGTEEPDKKNRVLRDKISRFKEAMKRYGCNKTVIGLCVSAPARKNNHFLHAVDIVGTCREDPDACVGLVMIGNYPNGKKFERARAKVIESPYILFIEEQFSVNEPFIADQIDFVYKSLSDQSVAYTLYVAASIKKPVITHNTGALPFIIEKEKLGCSVEKNDNDIPGKIAEVIDSWHPSEAKNFLALRSWKTGAEKIVNAVEYHPKQLPYGGERFEVLYRQDQVSGQ